MKRKLLGGLSAAAASVASVVTVLALTAGGAAAVTACSGSSSPVSIFSGATPTNSTNSDRNSVNLGVKFSSTQDGTVSAVEFYKGAGNTGTHVGSLWNSAGQLLESVTFVNESASGWQTAYFSSPVAITAGATYTASYLAPAAHYALDEPYAWPHSAAPLTGLAGTYVYGTASAFPTKTYDNSNYWVDVLFNPAAAPSSPSSTSASPSASPTSASPSPSPTSASPTPTPTTPTPTPTSASPTPTPTQTVPPGSYVQPGSVGYLGATSALTVYQPGGAALPGCSWQSYGLRCNNTDDTWDHVWIKGSVYWAGTGTLKVTNSIITGNPSQGWYSLLGHPSSSGSLPGATLDVEDSTLNFAGNVPGNVDSAPIWSAYGNQKIVALRDDLSGMAQGIDPTDSSVIEDNYIHGLVQNGTGGTIVHLDGIFSQGGANILIQGNYVDAPVRSDTTAALFIQDRPFDPNDTGIQIKSNYLNGGAYVLRNQTGVSVDVEGNTFGAGVWGDVGDTTGYQGTYGTWSGNVHTDGSPVPKP